MIAVFGNNCSTTLAAAITSSGQTSVEVVSTTGWPTIGAGEYMELTLNDQGTGQVFEVTYVTSYADTTATVLRGQEGTTAQSSWAIGDLAYGAVSAGQLNTFLQTALALTAPTVPCGRLTLQQSSGGISYPFPTTTVSDASAIYYTPYGGSLVSVYNGSAWAQYALTELLLTLTSGQNASGALYDIFLIYASGSLVLVTGPAWTNGTTRSLAIESTIGGLWTNTTLFTGYNDGTGYSVAANTGLYVGSIYCDTTAAVSMQFGSGYFGVYNQYNRMPFVSSATLSSQPFNDNSWHTSGNQFFFLDGAPNGEVATSFTVTGTLLLAQGLGATALDGVIQFGIGFDITNGSSGQSPELTTNPHWFSDSGTEEASLGWAVNLSRVPTIGLHYYVLMLNASWSGGTSNSFNVQNTLGVLQLSI